MIQAFIIAVCTAIGGGIGYYLDSPWLGVVVGCVVGVGIIVGAIGEIVGGIIDWID